jgi:hypothetical protein
LVRIRERPQAQFETSGHAWENPTLDRYLEALAAWLTDLEGWYAHRQEPMPDQPDWSLVAQMLAAASVYE